MPSTIKRTTNSTSFFSMNLLLVPYLGQNTTSNRYHLAHCNLLQRTLQLTATHRDTHCNTEQNKRSKTKRCHLSHYITLQHIATHCNTLHCTATYCNTEPNERRESHPSLCNAKHDTATQCNTLQHTTTHCNTLQHTAIHCNTLKHTATH